MDHEKRQRYIRGMIEGAAEGLVEVAKTASIALDVVVTAATSETGIAIHVMVNTGATGALPAGAVDALSEEASAAVSRFLRKCPNLVMRFGSEEGAPWKNDNN